MPTFTSINESNKSSDSEEHAVSENTSSASDDELKFDYDSILDEAFAQVESQEESELSKYRKQRFNELANHQVNKQEQNSLGDTNVEIEESAFKDISHRQLHNATNSINPVNSNTNISALTADNEILIPADGDCLYTSVFVGYLLSIIANPVEFNQRLIQLTGVNNPHSEKLRKDLSYAIRSRDIHYFHHPHFKHLISLFRIHMGLNDGLWGGIDEINRLAQQLNIVIQELVVNPDEGEEHYTAIDEPQNINSNIPLETIFILRTNPANEETLQISADMDLQRAQTASASTSQHLQHYRLISSSPINALEEISSPEVVRKQPQHYDLPRIKAARTVKAAKDIHESFQAIFNPTRQNATDSLQSAFELITGRPDTEQLFARVPEFVGTHSTYPHLKSSEYKTLTQLMVRTGMQERPQYFEALSEDEPVTEDTGLGVAFNFLKEFVQQGALDSWVSEIQRVIASQEVNNSNQAGLEFFNGMVNLVKTIVNAPHQSPLDKYVDTEDLQHLEAKKLWLENNQGHQDYDIEQAAFIDLYKKIKARREQAMVAGGEYMVSLFKRMRTEFADKDMHEILSHQEAEWQIQQRQAFEKAVLEYYGQPDPFESNHIRAFGEMLFRQQYGKIYYKMVCESFEAQYKESRVHQLVKQIWSVSQLDTIHHQPQEARSRMPGRSFDGLPAPNFGYRIERSAAYQKWIKNPLVRANADIIMDTYHILINVSSELNIDKFIDCFLNHLSDDRAVRLSIYEHPHPYDDFILAFELYLLKDIYKKNFIEERDIASQLFDVAGSKEKLIETARQALCDLRDFAKKMLEFRPAMDGTTAQKTDGLVFGIGFNGGQFDSPQHIGANTNEIWLTFSDSARTPGGYLLLALMKAVATSPSNWLARIVANQPNELAHYYRKYHALIYQHVNAWLKWFHEEPDFMLNSESLTYIKEAQYKYESFLIQLEAKIPFDQLSVEFKQWLRQASNWYRVSPGVMVKIAEKMPEEEQAAQKLARELLFDAVSQRAFSLDYPELMPSLFLHWKQALLAVLAERYFEKKLERPLGASPFGSLFGFDYRSEKSEIFRRVKKARTLDEVPEEFKIEVIDTLNNLVAHVHSDLKVIWEPAINKEYVEFKTKYLNGDIKKANNDIGKKQKILKNAREKVNTKALSSLEAALEKANKHLEQLESQRKQLPEHVNALSRDQFIAFRNYFFDNRDVSQCVEPVFAHVLGHDRFFSVYISQKSGETEMRESNQAPLQLGNLIPQDVIAPCNRRCQHHALGHLYTGDMLAEQSADRLDQIRQTHELGEVPDRFMTFDL